MKVLDDAKSSIRPAVLGFEMKSSGAGGAMSVISDYLRGWSCLMVLDVRSTESPFKQLLEAVKNGFDACGVLASWQIDPDLVWLTRI